MLPLHRRRRLDHALLLASLYRNSCIHSSDVNVPAGGKAYQIGKFRIIVGTARN